VLQRVERDRQARSIENRRQNLLRKELAWLRRGAPARTSKPKFRLDAAAALIADEPPPRDSVQLVRFATARLGRSVVDVEDVDVAFGERRVTVADFTRLPVHCPYIAFVPQWDFLTFLAGKAAELSTFTLRRSTEVTGLLVDAETVVGVAARSGGETIGIEADLVIGADGRHSITREAAGLQPSESAAPIDVFWLRIPRRLAEDVPLFTGGHGSLISIDRGDYWQLAYAFPRGAADAIRAEGLPALRSRITSLRPEYGDRLEMITDWADIHQLTVRVDRLRRWHRRGLLCIGDAAHAMSPVGGVGINLAISDAVAAANLMGPDLLRAQQDPDRFEKVLNPAILDRVQRRRQWPTMVTQRVQVLGQNQAIRFTETPEGRSLMPPRPVRALMRGPVARLLPRVFVYGVRPERIAR